MEVRWYYRPEDTIAGRSSFHGQKELFLSDQCGIVTADRIKGKCFVDQSISTNDYMQIMYAAEEYYYSRFIYEAATGTFSPAAVELYCKCQMPYNPDIMMVKCVNCYNRFHPLCLGMTDDQVKLMNQYMCNVCSDHVAIKARDGIDSSQITNDNKVTSDVMTLQRTENQPSEEMQQAESDSRKQEKAENRPSEDMQHAKNYSRRPQRAENQQSDEAPVLFDLATPQRAKSQPSKNTRPVKTDLPKLRKAEKRPKPEAQPVIIDLEADEQAQLIKTDWVPPQRAEKQSAKRTKLGTADRERINKVLKHSWMERIRDNWGWGEDQKIKLQLPLTDPASQYTVDKLGVMSLAPGKWVNSEIIDAYRILLRNREQRLKEERKAKGSRSYFFMSPWFMVDAGKYVETYASGEKKEKLQLEQDTKSRESFLRCNMRQAEGPTVTEADSILFPCNVRENHWVLFVWSVADWNVQVLDSINDRRKNTSITRKYKYDKVCIIEKMIPEMLSYCNPSGRYPKRFPKCNLVEKRPKQLNEYDCGVMVCMYMAFIVQGYDLAEVSFNQDEIDNFHYRIAHDIQNGQASDVSQF